MVFIYLVSTQLRNRKTPLCDLNYWLNGVTYNHFKIYSAYIVHLWEEYIWKINTCKSIDIWVATKKINKNSTSCYESSSVILDRVLLLTRKLLNKWFLLVKLKSSFRKYYGRHHDLVDRYGISVSQISRTCSSCMIYHRVYN